MKNKKRYEIICEDGRPSELYDRISKTSESITMLTMDEALEYLELNEDLYALHKAFPTRRCIFEKRAYRCKVFNVADIGAANKFMSVVKELGTEWGVLFERYGCIYVANCEDRGSKQRLPELIVSEVDCRYGAPTGRNDVGERPKLKRVFDSAVPMSRDSAYDKGGAYWGLGKQLRVKYTKDLSYIHFYRLGDAD
jgi:hypothetical protein